MTLPFGRAAWLTPLSAPLFTPLLASLALIVVVRRRAVGAALRLQNAYRQAASDLSLPPIPSAEVRFTGDSVIVDVSGGGRTVTQRFATTRGGVPFLNLAALVEWLRTIMR